MSLTPTAFGLLAAGWALAIGLGVTVWVLWFEVRHWRSLAEEWRKAGGVDRDTLGEVLDRLQAKDARDVDRRLRAAERRKETIEHRRAKREGETSRPARRRQPQSHAHIPQLSGFDEVHLDEKEGVAKCYSFDGDSQIVRIPLESYWSLVEESELEEDAL